MKQRKFSSPETLVQARKWEVVKARYVELGLCEKCAAQAAYGHQSNSGGWPSLNPPCDRCTETVGTFPFPTTNAGWRKILGTVPPRDAHAVHQIGAQRQFRTRLEVVSA